MLLSLPDRCYLLLSLKQEASKAPDRTPFMLDIISTGIANPLTIYWAQRKTCTDNSGTVTEGTVTTLAAGTC